MELLLAVWAFCMIFNLLPATPLTKNVINIAGLIIIVLCIIWPEFGSHVNLRQ